MATKDVLAEADRLREDDLYNQAIELYAQLLEQGDSPDAHFGIGQCYGKVYDYDRALEHLDKAFAADSERSDGASYYAYILERHGRMDDADRWYRQALEGAETDDLWARSHYAWFLEKWGRTDDACRAYDDVLERNAAHTRTIKRYALLLHRLGQPDRARQLLLDAVPGNKFAALNYLEYLLFTDDDEYPSFRASMEPLEGPAWYPVVVELFDYYRDHLLGGTSDPDRLAKWEADAEALTDSVHRDFDDLSAKLADRGGDTDTWQRQIQLLLK